jgi:hypothetical protein
VNTETKLRRPTCLIIRRFETETGESALLTGTGETHDELAERRAGTAGAENRASHRG